MSIASEISRIQGAKADLKTSIEAKGVTVPSSALIDTYSGYVDQISGGGGGVETYDDDVIFIDFDGKVLYRYTAVEFLALASMPANPSHDGLTAQGWNWDLQDAKTYVTECGNLIVGQMYVTDDGKTRYYITLDDPAHLSPTFRTKNGAIIDWGDGTTETSTTSLISHTYVNTGDYVISIQMPVAGSSIPSLSDDVANKRDYFGIVRHLRMGTAADNGLSTYFAQYLHNLEDVTIPSSITTFNTGGTFYGCSELKAVVLPKNLTTCGNMTFLGCASIRVVSINKTATFGNNPFQFCVSLEVLNLPPSLTAIPSNSIFHQGNLKKVTIPAGPTALTSSGFQEDISLSYVKLPSTLTSLTMYSFNNCYRLTSIEIPASVTMIDQRAFQAANIKEITIPASVTSIGNYAFYQAPWLYYVHVLATTPPTAGTGIFLYAPVQKIYVPAGTLSAYQSASGWSTYASLMEEE